jgi:hypothetical protein
VRKRCCGCGGPRLSRSNPLSPPFHPPCVCSDKTVKELEAWGLAEAKSYFIGAHLSDALHANVSALLVQDLLRLDAGAQRAFCEGARGCSGEDEARLQEYFWDLRADILSNPSEYSLWVQDVVRGRQFKLWSVLWAFAPTASLALIHLYSGVRLNYSLWANLFCPYHPFAATAWYEFFDSNPVWTLAFCAACTLATVINLLFLLQAARDKWLRIPFLLVVELFTMLLVWLGWSALALVLPEAALALLSRAALLAVPVIRYYLVIPFQDGEFNWLRELTVQRRAKR